MNQPTNARREKNLGREILFRLISISLPLLFLLLLEGVLRLVSYGDNLDLFIQNPVEGYESYMIVNPVVGKKYFHKMEYTAPPNDIFLKKKPEGTFRVFVMGSSTVLGFPYEKNLMFSRILHKRLEDAYPGRDIEVVNTAITAINSYTLLDFAGQIATCDPDAVLVYAGHNEFYGAFGAGSNESMSRSRWLTRLNLALMDFRFFQLIKNISAKTAAGKSEQVHGTLMKRIVASQDIPYESEAYQLAMIRYKQNMGDLLAIFSDRQIPVFFSEVVSNVKDIKPLSALSAGKEDEAWEAYVQAAAAFKRGAYDDARKFYYKAKDLDGVRFRASEEVNKIIRELALEYETCLVPMLDQFQAASPHSLIGNNVMTEHVHPNIEGAFLMADAFYMEIAASGLLGEEDQNSGYPSAYYKANWGYTRLDSLLAHHRIANLKTHWPFVPVERGEVDYRLAYHPVSMLDSIAFSAMKDPGKSLFDMRLSLAKEYESKGNMEAAYDEYEAMLRINPYLAVNYRDAASALIKLGDLPLALNYFKKSLEYEPSFYALYRMGEISLIKGDDAGARSYFREGFSLATDNEDKLKSLGKLYQACVYDNQPAEAKAIAGQLEKYGATQYLRIPPKSYTYTRYIPYQTRNRVLAAQQMMSESRFAEAGEILEGSLKIYDSHMARRYLGECYLQLGDSLNARKQFDRVKEEFAFDPAFRLQSLPNQTLHGVKGN